jgi:HAD superfamily hydrolase (TIGR01484 family)
MRVGIVVTDLDGTLLDSQHRLSPANRQTLVELGHRGITRVVATGRSLFSLCKVLGPDAPVDFVAHSSGAGIVSWPDLQSVRALHMSAAAAAELVAELVSRRHDFMLHRSIPDSHHFYAHRSSESNADFDRRLRLYADYAEELRLPLPVAETMCQALVITPPSLATSHAELRAALPGFEVIRTTSPLDASSMWIEIFPVGVGKAAASAWLRERERPEPCLCLAIGNDYNDLDLLDWADLAFVVANAPAELRARYRSVGSNDQSGFSEAILSALG